MPKATTRIQVNIINEEDNSRSRQIYESTKKGKLLRSAKLENQAQVLDMKEWNKDEGSSESGNSEYDSPTARENRIRQN